MKRIVPSSIFSSSPLRLGLVFILFANSFYTVYAQSNTTPKLEERRKGTEKLGFLVGEWESETWYYLDGKRPSEPEKGTYKAEWTLNGAFITDDISAAHQGNPYLGKSYHTYNPNTKLFETYYFDSDGLVVLYPNGKWENTQTLVFSGKDADHSRVIEKRTYFQIHSTDSFDLVEKQDYGDGKGFVTVLEVKYQRKR
ncbi:hypothetical protein FGF1_38410 [Flavobacteriaceae bacterium GF1]